MMRASLQLNLSQQLRLTPQLQQAIRLLQLSSLELQAEIQQAVETNPLLEWPESQPPSPATGSEKAVKANDIASEQRWDDPRYHRAKATTDPVNLEQLHAAEQDLRDHLHWQLSLSTLEERDRAIATHLIDAIDDDGFLTDSIEQIHQHLLTMLTEPRIELDEIQAVLRYIQRFDPVGVGARDLKECLIVQLDHLPGSVPSRAAAKSIIKQHLSLLGKQQYSKLMQITGLHANELKDAMALIQSLHPKPGRLIAKTDTEYLIPDVLVEKHHQHWQVHLNPQAAPKLSINNHYAQLVKRNQPSADNTFIRQHLQEARWFLKSLQSRHDTLLRVAHFIVTFQQGFFERGDIAMKPLVLSQVAEALELHESTISRVTTNKYMHTPHGMFELKYFFSTQLGNDLGEAISATAIKARIRHFIAQENAAKPLSDTQIMRLLAEKNICIARRTVAKYREALQIPASHERKIVANMDF